MVAMASPQKHPKTGIYWFRRAVPADLREKLGKWEIKHSLKTRNPAEAKRLFAQEFARSEETFAAARTGIALTTTQARALAGKWLKDRLDADAQSREVDDPKEFLVDTGEHAVTIYDLELDALAEAFEKGTYLDLIRADVEELLRAEALPISPGHRNYELVAEQLALAKIKLLNIKRRRAYNDWRPDGALKSYPAYKSPLKSPVSPTRPKKESQGNGLTALFNAWCGEQIRAPKTRLEFDRAVRRFVELHGEVPAIDITKAMIRAYKEALQKLPVVLSGPMRKMTVPQILAAVEGQVPRKTLSVGSINKDIGSISAILSWAGRNGYFDENPNWSNPATGMKIDGPKVEAETRLPYSVEDMKLIFNSPVFSQGERTKGGAGEAAKWLPLLALYTGARLEELGQLLIRDVVQEDGVWRIHINTLDEGKRVKTKATRRKVPLHNELVRCGFLGYVDGLQKAGTERLFPALSPNKDGKLTGSWSKWWGRYARGLGITDSRKVFHSFRHNFKDAVRAAGVEEAINDALTGHTGGGVGRTYGVGYNLVTLNKALRKVRYKGLDLSHLRAPENPKFAA